MNTSITSEFYYGHSLLPLIETYDTIDISGISTICTSPNQLADMISSGNFVGMSSPSFNVDGSIDDDDKNYFNSLGLKIN